MRLKVVLAVVAALAVLVVGGSWFFIFKSDPPERLTIDDTSAQSTATTAAPAGAGSADGTVDGEWSATSASIVGYRVKETLFGASTEAVGRTSAVEGSITISGTQVTKGVFTVDMTTVKSDRSQRDGQFHGRIMETSQFKTSTFELTKPIELTTTELDQEVKTKATGKLTLHGVTKPVTFDVVAKRTAGEIRVNGAIPVNFDDYDIDDPSGGPAQVGDDGTLEFTLVFAK